MIIRDYYTGRMVCGKLAKKRMLTIQRLENEKAVVNTDGERAALNFRIGVLNGTYRPLRA